jgi:hypothetical protein
MTGLSSDPALLDALKQAARYQLSHEELRQQRIDYIVGCLSDEGTAVTRAQVVRELEKLVGSTV